MTRTGVRSAVCAVRASSSTTDTWGRLISRRSSVVASLGRSSSTCPRSRQPSAARASSGLAAAGDASGLCDRYGLAVTEAAAYPVERRRGWRETPDAPGRAVTDPWDEKRADKVRMTRPQPEQARGHAPRSGGTRPWLVVTGGYAAHRTMPRNYDPPRYELLDKEAGSVLEHLDEVQWADWARGGELLTATTDGRLQIRDRTTLQVAWEHDLAPMHPDGDVPPAEAGRR